jgi:hypothetical protein
MAGFPAPAQMRPTKGMVGKPGTGAAVLSGYFIDGKPCLPMKKFTLDAGYDVNISPSGRHVGIIVEKKISMLLDGKNAVIQNQRIPLSVQPVARDNDYFLPLEFFEKAFPAQFRYNGSAKVVIAQFSEKKILRVPIKPLPRQP